MRKSESTPWWVFLAFSSIETRRGALLMVLFNVLLTVYCLPWAQFFGEIVWVDKLFIVHGWSWFVMMLAMTAWYGLAFIWANRHVDWEGANASDIVEDIVERAELDDTKPMDVVERAECEDADSMDAVEVVVERVE